MSSSSPVNARPRHQPISQTYCSLNPNLLINHPNLLIRPNLLINRRTRYETIAEVKSAYQAALPQARQTPATTRRMALWPHGLKAVWSCRVDARTMHTPALWSSKATPNPLQAMLDLLHTELGVHHECYASPLNRHLPGN